MENHIREYGSSNAVVELKNAGFQAEAQAFGFSVNLQDSHVSYHVECGHESDESISISVSSGTPPTRWFLRSSIREIVDLLMMAKELIKSRQARTWVKAFDQIENR